MVPKGRPTFLYEQGGELHFHFHVFVGVAMFFEGFSAHL